MTSTRFSMIPVMGDIAVVMSQELRIFYESFVWYIARKKNPPYSHELNSVYELRWMWELSRLKIPLRDWNGYANSQRIISKERLRSSIIWKPGNERQWAIAILQPLSTHVSTPSVANPQLSIIVLPCFFWIFTKLQNSRKMITKKIYEKTGVFFN